MIQEILRYVLSFVAGVCWGMVMVYFYYNFMKHWRTGEPSIEVKTIVVEEPKKEVKTTIAVAEETKQEVKQDTEEEALIQEAETTTEYLDTPTNSIKENREASPNLISDLSEVLTKHKDFRDKEIKYQEMKYNELLAQLELKQIEMQEQALRQKDLEKEEKLILKILGILEQEEEQ